MYGLVTWDFPPRFKGHPQSGCCSVLLFEAMEHLNIVEKSEILPMLEIHPKDMQYYYIIWYRF